ncbi:hypothetical protein ACI3EY_16745 [Ornithinimicrobium sp. LYQ92]|uniref:hypothetical protein n=1 Tax=Serinicoccus sp. LYQ92 TaxID=3378798 RepID=UPI00385338C1
MSSITLEKVHMTMGYYEPDGGRVLVNTSGYDVVAGFTADEVRQSLVDKATDALAGLLTSTGTENRAVLGRMVDVTVMTWDSGEKFFEFWIDRPQHEAHTEENP